MEAAMEKKNMEIQAINHQTIGQRLKSYKRSPLSLVLLLLVSVSALLTVLTSDSEPVRLGIHNGKCIPDAGAG